MLPNDTLAALPDALRRPLVAFAGEYLADSVPFGGRDSVLAALDAWLADPERPCALVVAEAGRGKSALLARWTQRVVERVRAVFVPVSIRFGTALRTPSMMLLDSQLRRFAGTSGEAPRDAEAARAEIESILAGPRNDELPWLVVLDGVDEAVGWSLHHDLRLLADPVPGLKILVSARALASCDLDGWRQRLGWSAQRTLALTLPALDARDVVDVLQKMGDPIASLGDRVEIAGMLARVTEGDPLVLRLYVDALRAQGNMVSFITPSDVSQLPPGIDGYLDRWWAEQRTAWQGSAPRFERDARELLCALAIALGPLMREDLDALVPGHHPEVRDAILRALGRLVIGDGREQGYVFSHPRLAHYHVERLSADEFASWERRFIEYGKSVRARLASGGRASAYILRHHGAHLERSGAGFRELSNLVTPEWQRAWEAVEGFFDGFLADVERAWTHAEAALAEDPAEGPAAAAALYRLALVRTSTNSIVGNVSNRLLAGLVEARIWSPAVALAYAGQNMSAIAAIAPFLPESLVDAALGNLDPRRYSSEFLDALVALLRRWINRGDAHHVLPALSRHMPWNRAWALVVLAPLLPERQRLAAWNEIRACAAAHLVYMRVALSLELAAQVPQHDRAVLLAQVHKAQHRPTDKDLTQFARAGDLEYALCVARDERDLFTRSGHFAHILAGVHDAKQARTIFHEWETVERALWVEGRTILKSDWPLPLSPSVVAVFLDLVRELPFPLARAKSLTRTAQIYRIAIPEALAAVQALAEPERLFGLLALASVLDERERRAALAHVLAGVRAYQRTKWAWEWENADRYWQWSDESKIDRQPPNERGIPELLATVAGLLPEAERAPVLREALARSRAIEDAEYRSQALAAMAVRLDGTSRTEVLAQARTAARAALPGPQRSRALADLVFTFPEVAPEVVTTVDLAVVSQDDVMEIAVTAATALPIAERHDALRTIFAAWLASKSRGWPFGALDVLAPHLPADLLEFAFREVSKEQAVALAAYGVWSLERQAELVTAAFHLVTDVLRLLEKEPSDLDRRSTWLHALAMLAPRLSVPQVREAIAMLSPSDCNNMEGPLELLLLRLAECGKVVEALGVARDVDDLYTRIRLLCRLIPCLRWPVRNAVAEEVMEQVRAMPADRYPKLWGMYAEEELDAFAAIAVPGTRRRENVARARHVLDASAVLAPLGYGVELATIAGRLLGGSRAISTLLKIAGGMDGSERRAVLAMAFERALVLDDKLLSRVFPQLAPHASDLDRRGFAAVFGRKLRMLGHGRRKQFLIEDSGDRNRFKLVSKVDSGQLSIISALDALGGKPAILEAARACIEVGEWFP